MTPPQFQYESAGTDFTQAMSKETKQCIEMIKYILKPSTHDATNEKNTHHLQQQLRSMDLQRSSQEITRELSQLVSNWSTTYNQRLQSTQSLYGTPSVITRYWIPALASYFCGSWSIRYGFKRKEDIIHYTQEFGKTAHDFILNWIWEPMVKVYSTIRLKDQRLSLLSKEGLQGDLDVSISCA
jgi:nuclear-control-of-ATPase protein 2